MTSVAAVWPAVPSPGSAEAVALVAHRRQEDGSAEADSPPPHLRDKLLRRPQLADLPQPEPLIDDTLDQRTVALLAGRNSTGKSFLALDWACCIATGQRWQGREVATFGPVLCIAAEGAHGLHQRVSAWEHSWGRGTTVDALDVLPLAVTSTPARASPTCARS